MSIASVTVTLLRHCESVFNVDDVHFGATPDPPLTPFGTLVASRLTGDYDLILTSPLTRCVQTVANARLTSLHGVHTDARLREWAQDACDFLPDELPQSQQEDEGTMMARVSSVVEWCASGCDGHARVLLVTHGDWITYFVLLAGGTLEHEDYPGNGTMTHFCFQDGRLQSEGNSVPRYWSSSEEEECAPTSK